MKSPSYTENNIQLYIINSSWKNKNKNLKKEKKKKKKKKWKIGKLENWKIGKFHTMRQVIVPTHTPTFPWVQTWAVSIPRGQSSRPHDHWSWPVGTWDLHSGIFGPMRAPFCSVGVNPGYVFLQVVFLQFGGRAEYEVLQYIQYGVLHNRLPF